jgi:hypothetical protein
MTDVDIAPQSQFCRSLAAPGKDVATQGEVLTPHAGLVAWYSDKSNQYTTGVLHGCDSVTNPHKVPVRPTQNRNFQPTFVSRASRQAWNTSTATCYCFLDAIAARTSALWPAMSFTVHTFRIFPLGEIRKVVRSAKCISWYAITGTPYASIAL